MIKMKNSGIEWIGEVPEHWEILRHKNIMKKKKDICLSYKGEDILSLTMNGVIKRDLENPSGKMPTTFDGYQIVEEGNLLLCLFDIDVTPRCVGLIQNNGLTSPAYSQFILTDGDYAPYYNYLLMMIDNNKSFLHLSKNLRSSLTEDDFGAIKTIKPTLAEQKKIAQFLDKKLSQIDKLLKLEEEEIKILKDYKTALITHFVVKGNNKYNLNETGIGLIGEIPEHWELKKLKYCCSIVRGGSPRPIEEYISNNDEGYHWIKIGDTEKDSKYINGTKEKIIEKGLSKTRLVHKNDLILTNSMSYGEPYILNIDGCIHDGWVAFSNYKGVVKEFLYYFLSSSCCKEQFKTQVAGGVVQNLNIDKIGNTYIVLPDIETQKNIIKELEEKMDKVNVLLNQKLKKVEELHKFKQTILFEYVTGKKEI